MRGGVRSAFRKDKTEAVDATNSPDDISGLEEVIEEVAELDEATLARIEAVRRLKQENEVVAQHARAHALSIMAKHLFEEAVKQRLICQDEFSDYQNKQRDVTYSPKASNSSHSGDHYTHSYDASLNYSVNTLRSVALRIVKGNYSCWPPANDSSLSWITSLSMLNVGAAMTVRSTATQGIINLLAPDAQEVMLSASSRIQVLQDVDGLARARKAQGVAFIRSMGCMIVWSDRATQLLQEAQTHHSRVLRFLWRVVEPDAGEEMISEAQPETPSAHHGAVGHSSITESPSSYFHLIPHSTSGYNDTSISPSQSILDSPYPGTESPGTQSQRGIFPNSSSQSHLVLGGSKKKPTISPSTSLTSTSDLRVKEEKTESPRSKRSLFGLSSSKEEKIFAQEEGQQFSNDMQRPTVMISSIQHGLAAGLAIIISLLGTRGALQKSLFDGNWMRLALAALMPLTFILVMFFCDSIMTFIFMMIGPVRQLRQNSRFYSGKRPDPLQAHEVEQLPHITIQMPVYKESLEGVLKPSFESVKKAIQTYELQGGSASIIVSEDGFLLVDEVERNARLSYYEENNITWIARPKHGDQGFIRPGRFKKASNLNFTYEIMRRVELRMQQDYPQLFHAETRKPIISNYDDRASWQQYYNNTMQTILKEVHPTADGSGVDQIGEFILMIDSDTRIPADCFMDAAAEMTRCKDVGVLQHCSGVMQVTSSFFESCIAYFTRIVNFSITFAVANGDVAPFMGHNAYLRWSAMQEIATEEVDEKGLVSYKVWSDEHVSEDFVMALDMLQKGYIVRWATYDDNSYIEGVSLTCTDELNRWQKYAWGVSEMMFNPFKLWYKGPFTPLIRRFWLGSLPIHYKWAASSYCFSYYAVALALPLSIFLTIIKGWFDDGAVGLYSTNFQTLVSVIVIYLGGGCLGIITIRYRAGKGSWGHLAWESIKHIPFMTFFFCGLSYHVSTALLSHMLSINMTWGATLKDVEQTTVWAELPSIFKRFWRMFLICFTVIGGVIVTTFSFIPLQFQLSGVTDLLPVFSLCIMHILYPFVLNPNLVHFSF